MAPIMISNQRPGFVPLSPRQLSVAGRAPFRPAYAPAPYRPPMLSNPSPSPRMGVGLFSLGELPLSLSLGLGGAGAFVLSGVLPTPAKELATIVGFSLLGWAILNLFSGTASASTSTEEAAGTPFNTPKSSQFGLVTAKITKPSPSESVSRGAFSQDYDVEVLWTNGSTEKVSMPYRIYVEEAPEAGLLSYGLMPFKGAVYTGVVNLGPGQSVPVPLELDLKSEGLNVGGAVGITMKVQKISASGQIFDADKRFFVVY